MDFWMHPPPSPEKTTPPSAISAMPSNEEYLAAVDASTQVGSMARIMWRAPSRQRTPTRMWECGRWWPTAVESSPSLFLGDRISRTRYSKRQSRSCRSSFNFSSLSDQGKAETDQPPVAVAENPYPLPFREEYRRCRRSNRPLISVHSPRWRLLRNISRTAGDDTVRVSNTARYIFSTNFQLDWMRDAALEVLPKINTPVAG